MYKSVDDEIKEQEKKLEELHQMRHALQHNAKEAFEAVYGKEDEVQDVKHSTVEEMEKELRENAEHQMEYVNDLKIALKNRSHDLFFIYIFIFTLTIIHIRSHHNFCLSSFCNF